MHYWEHWIVGSDVRARAPVFFARGPTVAMLSGPLSDGEVVAGEPRDSAVAIRVGSSLGVHGFFTPPAYTAGTGKLLRR